MKQSANDSILCGKISLSKDGEWYHEGVEITHERTVELFHRSLRKEGKHYVLRVGSEVCSVEIEDAPYVVRGVAREGDNLILELSNFSNEPLDASTLKVGDHNVLYARVGAEKERARFSRPAYYQLTKYLHENPDGGYFLRVGKSEYLLKI